MSRSAFMLVFAALIGISCASALEETVRRQAAVDMGCPEGQVAVRDLRSDNYVRDFNVQACGRQAHYQAACSMVGSCTAYQARELGEHPLPGTDALTAGVEDLHPSAPTSVPTVIMAGSAEPIPMVPVVEPEPERAASVTVVNTVETRGTGAAAGDGNEQVVTLRSGCPRTVTLFVGAEPGAEGGVYMTLGAGSTIAPRVATGTSLWLLDAKQAGIASVSLDASMREVTIAENCGGLAAR